MRTPRFFRLINGNGEVLSLLSHNYFFNKPTGLGFERDDSYRSVGDRFVRVNSKLKQQTISGSFWILDSVIGDEFESYEKYFRFMQFIGPGNLILCYTPDPAGSGDASYEYRRHVVVDRIEKGELDEYGQLEVNIEFLSSQPWYRRLDIDSTTYEADSGWIWNKTAIWKISDKSIKWGKGSSTFLQFYSNSYMDSPIRLKMYGPVSNPVWRHYVDGELIETGKINIDVQANQYLQVSNVGDPYSIGLVDNDGTWLRSAYQNSDFSTDRFMNVKHGLNTISVFNANMDSLTKLVAEVYLYYESV